MDGQILRTLVTLGSISPTLRARSERLERLTRLTCSPMFDKKVVDILQDFRLCIKSLRIYDVS
jgi:hypothetical protein